MITSPRHQILRSLHSLQDGLGHSIRWGGGWLLPATRSFSRCAPSRMDLVINPCWRNEPASDEASGGVVDGCSPPPDPSVAALPPGWTCA